MMSNFYPIDYTNLYGMKYRIYLSREQLAAIFPDFESTELEDAWYNCTHDKIKGIRRSTPRDLFSEEETFAIDEGHRIIRNQKYNPPNRDCKECNRGKTNE